MSTVIPMKEQSESFYKHIKKATSLKPFLANSLHPRQVLRISHPTQPHSPPLCFVLFFLFPPPQLAFTGLGP